MKILSNKKYLIFFLFPLFLTSTKAQEVSNFTIQTVDSISYNLYDYLDDGIPVVLDMFSRF